MFRTYSIYPLDANVGPGIVLIFWLFIAGVFSVVWAATVGLFILLWVKK